MNKKEAQQQFGLQLRRIRAGKELSQEALAKCCQLDRTYISGVERGLRNPSLDCILRIARGLDVRPEELIRGVNFDAY